MEREKGSDGASMVSPEKESNGNAAAKTRMTVLRRAARECFPRFRARRMWRRRGGIGIRVGHHRFDCAWWPMRFVWPRRECILVPKRPTNGCTRVSFTVLRTNRVRVFHLLFDATTDGKRSARPHHNYNAPRRLGVYRVQRAERRIRRV